MALMHAVWMESDDEADLREVSGLSDAGCVEQFITVGEGDIGLDDRADDASPCETSTCGSTDNGCCEVSVAAVDFMRAVVPSIDDARGGVTGQAVRLLVEQVDSSSSSKSRAGAIAFHGLAEASGFVLTAGQCCLAVLVGHTTVSRA